MPVRGLLENDLVFGKSAGGFADTDSEAFAAFSDGDGFVGGSLRMEPNVKSRPGEWRVL